jgi:uncharacterized phage-associated protein
VALTAKHPRLARWPFTLDADKAVEALLYVSQRVRCPTLHSLSKVLYHADKLHLSRYGRPITGDHYVAMKHGPVPSAMYDILKTIRGDSKLPLPPGAQDALSVQNGYEVIPRRDADMRVLSASERQCLDASAAEHGAKSFTQLTEDSHGPAWQAADENDVIVLESLLLEIDNRDELIAHLSGDD